MECVTSVYASVLVNGSPSGEFKLERGLRQEDPLSPFLYLLIAEGLSLLVSRATETGLFEAAEIGNNRFKVPMLQYTDDTMFLGAASIENAFSMKRILRMFEMLSGLKVNFQKSSLIGVNVDRGIMEEMACILRCNNGEIPFSFFGIRVGINYRKVGEWEHLIQKIRKRIKKWEDKKISFGG